jgi:hypothetical protein
MRPHTTTIKISLLILHVKTPSVQEVHFAFETLTVHVTHLIRLVKTTPDDLKFHNDLPDHMSDSIAPKPMQPKLWLHEKKVKKVWSSRNMEQFTYLS